MRLVHKCKMTHLLRLIGEVNENGYTDVEIVVTEAELGQILQHPKAASLFPEYFDGIAQKSSMIQFEILELKEQIRKLNDVRQKEELESQISDKESEVNDLSSHRKLKYQFEVNGITLRVAQIS